MLKVARLADIFPVTQSARSLSIGFLLAGLQVIGLGQSVTLSIGSGSATAGTTVSLPINLSSSGGAQTAGLQWSFIYSSDITSVTVVAGPSANNAGKSITCSATSCLLLGFNHTVMADGTVATATFQVASNPSTTSIPVQISGVVATTVAGDSIPASGSSGTISLPATAVSVGVSPSNVTLTASQSRQFTATVTGNTNTSVTWSMTPSLGSLSNGLYTAPSVINAAQSVTVTATSVADSSKSASATVQLTPIVSVGVGPPTATLTASQSAQFTATVTGSTNTSVTWSMTPSLGSLSNGLYTAPSVINAAQSVTVTATSAADPTKSASATVQLTPAADVSVGISPLSATLTASQSRQFTATVTGSTNTSVTWSMTPPLGSLSNGLYTAPSVINAAQSVTVTATSVADPTKSASATVQLGGNAPTGATPLTIRITSPTSQPTFTSSQTTINLAGTASANTIQVVWATDQGLQGQALGTTTWAAPGIRLRNGPNQITVTARDAVGNQSSVVMTVVVGLPTIVTTSLPDAQVGKPYSSKLAAVGGTPPFTWSAVAVANGLTVSQDGMVTGTPSIAGTFKLNITVQDSTQTGTTAALSLQIDKGLVLVSAASLKAGPVAPNSMVTVFGGQLAAGAQSATAQPLPTTLGDCTVTIKDANGVERAAGLYYVSPNQINFTIPADTAVGSATFTVISGGQTSALGNLDIATTAPGLFFLNADWLAAASLTRVNGNNTSYEEIAQLDSTTNLFVAIPIDLGSDTDQVYLTLYGTGFRLRSSLDSVQVLVAGIPALVDYAGPSNTSDGLDLVHVLLAKELRGAGMANVVITVNGVSSNGVRILIK
jgi:uncharacterized protein (TIGR03437 family)